MIVATFMVAYVLVQLPPPGARANLLNEWPPTGGLVT